MRIAFLAQVSLGLSAAAAFLHLVEVHPLAGVQPSSTIEQDAV
jgi:hypothetical protein